MWGAPTILKVAVPRFSGPCIDTDQRERKSGWTTTTTTALTAFLAAKHLTSAFVRKPKTRCHRPSSVAQSDERAHRAIK
jgi:hypothetical protein